MHCEKSNFNNEYPLPGFNVANTNNDTHLQLFGPRAFMHLLIKSRIKHNLIQCQVVARNSFSMKRNESQKILGFICELHITYVYEHDVLIKFLYSNASALALYCIQGANIMYLLIE